MNIPRQVGTYLVEGGIVVLPGLVDKEVPGGGGDRGKHSRQDQIPEIDSPYNVPSTHLFVKAVCVHTTLRIRIRDISRSRICIKQLSKTSFITWLLVQNKTIGNDCTQ